MHNAHEAGRRVEPNTVQPVRFHEKSIRHKLHRNVEVSATAMTCIECKFMRTAESGGSIFQTDCTRKMNCHLSSNYSYQQQPIETLLVAQALIININCAVKRHRQEYMFKASLNYQFKLIKQGFWGFGVLGFWGLDVCFFRSLE